MSDTVGSRCRDHHCIADLLLYNKGVRLFVCVNERLSKCSISFLQKAFIAIKHVSDGGIYFCLKETVDAADIRNMSEFSGY